MSFSVCISAYKAKFFKECIESVLNQTLPDFELIILNDCSPEPIDVIVKEFSDPRIKYIINEVNVGAIRLVENWNKCLKLAEKEYIVILGDDDRLEPNYLKEFICLIESFPKLDVYHCRSKIIDDDGHDIILTTALPNIESIYDNIWHRITGKRLQYISDFLYRTDTLRNRGGFFNLPLAWGSDDITSFIACGEKGIAHSNRPVFNYRRNRLSISSTGNVIDKLNSYNLYMDWLEEFLKNPPKNIEDRVIYNDLITNFKKYVKTKQMFMLTHDLQENTILKGIKYFSNREKIRFSSKDIMTGVMLSLARKLKGLIR